MTLLARNPNTPTVFPYTTLFRSLGGRLKVCWGVFGDTYSEFLASTLERYLPKRKLPADLPSSVKRPVVVVPMGKQEDSRQDRKSTRLNSSHSQISYAVFCLKKKN